MKWRSRTIGDLVALQRGHDLTDAERKEGTVPVIGSAGQNGSHEVARAKGPGVTIGRSGGSIGKVTFVDQDFWPHNTCIYVTDFKGNDPRFVAYLLGNIDLAQLNSGAAQPSLNRNFVYGVRVAYPDPPEQRRIAEMLSAYDELMENNRRRMRLLEEAVRLLYREWFVRLRFPGHEHALLTHGIPEGWERKPLGEYTSFLKRGIAPHYDDDAEGLVINQKCIRDGRLNMNLARHQSREFAPERQVQVGDVLVNSTGEGTLGRIAQVKSPVDNCTVDTHVTIVRPQPGIPNHYFGMAVMAWESQFSTMGRGATNQTELSPGQIGDALILMPNKTLLQEFESFADPIYQQVTNLVSQNQKLRTVRDLLLPPLMSGEIAV